MNPTGIGDRAWSLPLIVVIGGAAFPGVGHGLAEAKDEVFDLVSEWLLQKV